MTAISNIEIKKVILEFLSKNKEKLIYDNVALREKIKYLKELKPPKKGFFNTDPFEREFIRNFGKSSTDDIDCIPFIEYHIDDIWCFVSDQIGFIDIKKDKSNYIFMSTDDEADDDIDYAFFFTSSMEKDANVERDLQVWDLFNFDELEFQSEENDGEVDGCVVNLESEFVSAFNTTEDVIQKLRDLQEAINDYISKKGKSELETKRSEIISEHTENDAESIEIFECKDFISLVKGSQSEIIKIDKSYIHNFVKVSQYLSSKRSNILTMFDIVKNTKNIKELDKIGSFLKDEKNKYDLVLLNSFVMLESLLSSDLITFYEIYEIFDQLSLFNSSWENDTTSRLQSINDNLETIQDTLTDILLQQQKMEKNIISSIDNLSYITSEGFNNLGHLMETKLNAIGSQLRFNNLVTAVTALSSMRRLR